MKASGSIFSILQDYQNRSISHVASAPEISEDAGSWRAVTYRLGSHMLCSAFDQVIEITGVPPMASVPRTVPWLLGVANSRGNLLPIMDIKLFVLGERTVMHESQRMLVVQQTGGVVGMVVDELVGQRFFNDSMRTEDAGAFDEGRMGQFIRNTYRAFGKTWGVFDMDLLTRTPEFRQAAA